MLPEFPMVVKAYNSALPELISPDSEKTSNLLTLMVFGDNEIHCNYAGSSQTALNNIKEDRFLLLMKQDKAKPVVKQGRKTKGTHGEIAWLQLKKKEMYMKNLVSLLAGSFLVFVVVGSASAVSIDYLDALDGDGNLTTQYNWATVETFDNNTLLWDWSPVGDYTIRDGALVPGESAPPAGDTTKYVSIPQIFDNDNSASVTVSNLGGLNNYFGIFWGSVDSYNTLDFYNGNFIVASFTGSDAINPNAANGNQSDPRTNKYVNFYFGANEMFDSFVMSSSSMAFEADNIAIGTASVPEPTATLLIGTGLIGLAGVVRRKKKVD